jgi:hypothetical protein
LRFLRAYDWGRTFNFNSEHATVDIGYGNVPTIGIMSIPMSMLRSPIMTLTGFKVVTLEETPHYPWISDLVEGRDDADTRRDYRRYLGLYHLEDDADATVEKVVELVNAIRAEISMGDVPAIVTHPPSDYEGAYCAVIYDGNHRACIAKALGQSHMKCRIVEIEMTSEYFPPRYFDTSAQEPAQALVSATNLD